MLWKNKQLDELMLEEKTIEDRLKNNDIATINKNKHTLTFPQLKAINILEKNSKETREEYIQLVVRDLKYFSKKNPRLLKQMLQMIYY